MEKILIFAILPILIIVFGILILTREGAKLLEKEIFQKELKISQPETMEKIKITLITIYDNYQSNPELKTGWGFSCLIKINGKRILFDTGADSKTLLSNMEKMKI